MAKEKCEFCCKEKPRLATTTFYGWYCEDCLKIVKQETEAALKRIREAKKAGETGCIKEKHNISAEEDAFIRNLIEEQFGKFNVKVFSKNSAEQKTD